MAQTLASRLVKDFSSSSWAAFRATYYIPSFSKFNGSTVPGVQWLSERTSTSSSSSGNEIFLSGTKILCAVRDLASPPEEFVWDGSWFGHPGSQLIDQVRLTYTHTQAHIWPDTHTDTHTDTDTHKA